MMKLIKYPSQKILEGLFKRPSSDTSKISTQVRAVLDNVKGNGDKALKHYSKKFDGVDLKNFKVPKSEITTASKQLDEKLKKAIRLAHKNITTFHAAQKETVKRIKTMPGVVCWRESVPIQHVGLYIPGGTAPLFSTVLMLGVPAFLAGCEEVILLTPPDKNGNVHPAILYAAQHCSIYNIYKAGGAQAIAAMAYGTKSIPKVDKIFGPGNQYVTVAKQLVSNEGVAIDLPAGPSELCIIADETSVPEFVAADLLSQAEHGPDSQVVLISTKENVLKSCIEQVSKMVKQLPRREMALKALSNSACILVKSIDDAIKLSNQYAPEHLIIACRNDNSIADKVKNAGSVFLGNYSPESAGDYASGTNHTLPTAGYARSYSGVSLDSFMKKITFQQLSKAGIKNIGQAVEAMAEAEGLQAHKLAVSLRLKDL